MTAADKWDSMTQAEREAICPNYNNYMYAEFWQLPVSVKGKIYDSMKAGN